VNHLFLYQNGPRGDVLVSRALCAAVLANTPFRVTIGVCRGDEELMAGLEGPRCRIVAGPMRNTPAGAVLDLAALCPPDAEAVAVHLGGRSGPPTWQWVDVLDAFHRQLARRGHSGVVVDSGSDVPMLDFAGHLVAPRLRRPSIYLDNERTRDERCHFVFDFERLSRVLDGWDLLCTAPTGCQLPSLVDVSHLGWGERSRLSEACDVLVGTTRDPFVLTMTAANRWKPKALCGHDARLVESFWDYPGNPLELLATMDDLVDFLSANVVEAALR
jgi:hypothetical protein